MTVAGQGGRWVGSRQLWDWFYIILQEGKVNSVQSRRLIFDKLLKMIPKISNIINPDGVFWASSFESNPTRTQFIHPLYTRGK
jgi:hypothetical protein